MAGSKAKRSDPSLGEAADHRGGSVRDCIRRTTSTAETDAFPGACDDFSVMSSSRAVSRCPIE